MDLFLNALCLQSENVLTVMEFNMDIIFNFQNRQTNFNTQNGIHSDIYEYLLISYSYKCLSKTIRKCYKNKVRSSNIIVHYATGVK